MTTAGRVVDEGADTPTPSSRSWRGVGKSSRHPGSVGGGEVVSALGGSPGCRTCPSLFVISGRKTMIGVWEARGDDAQGERRRAWIEDARAAVAKGL